MKTFDGFLKRKLGDTNVLLAGGDHKALSDFIGSILYDSSTRKIKYTPVGGSATDLVTFGTLAFDSTSYLPLSGGTLAANNSWLSPARLQLLRPDGTAYTDRACVGVTDGNLHIDAYPNKGLYLNYYSSGGNVYFNGGSYYINGGYYNGTAAAANSVSWSNVSDKPFNWSGQSGQPTWLWGSNDGSNYYVWNPSNFSVNYATSAGYADSAGSVAWGNVTGKPSLVPARTIYWDTTPTASKAYIYNDLGYKAYSSTRNYFPWIGSVEYVTGYGYGNTISIGAYHASTSDCGLYIGASWDGATHDTFFTFGRWGDLTVPSNCYASNFYTSSDRTKKTNIESIASIVPIRKFNWKQDGSLSYGFIAQELVELGHEELVHGTEGNMTVNYDAALSWAMAILSNVVDDLRGRIIQLENKLSKYENL